MDEEVFKIVCFGDSTTDATFTSDEYPEEYLNLKVYSQWLQEQLPTILNRKIKIINSGVSGDTTADAKNRLKEDVLDHDPNLVIIQFGVNDQCIRQDLDLENATVSLEDFTYNILFLINKIRKINAKIVLVTPGMMLWNDNFRSTYFRLPYQLDKRHGLNGNLENYVRMIRKIALKEEVTLIDIYQKEMEFDNKTNHSISKLLPDGLHPNNKGHQFIANAIINHFKP